jgi:hypothetical protein
VRVWSASRLAASVDRRVFAAPREGSYITADGTIVAPRATDDEFVAWTFETELPTPEGLEPLVLARPVQLPGGVFVIAYNLVDEDAEVSLRTKIDGQRLAVASVSGENEVDYRVISLQDYGVEPSASIRSDLVLGKGEPPILYVATGGRLGGREAVRGRVFSVDLDAWAAGEEPVLGSFTTTEETTRRCDETSTRPDRECGGGVHGEASVSVVDGEAGVDGILVSSGKGATDVLNGQFANGVLRLDPDLSFDAGCDVPTCERAGGGAPECLRTCRNFFVPRMTSSQASVPKMLEDRCSRSGSPGCLETSMFDGSSAPISVFEENGRRLVWAGPDGFLYLLHHGDWSRPVARAKYAHVCSSDEGECHVPSHTPATTPRLDHEFVYELYRGPSIPGVPVPGERVVWTTAYSPKDDVPGGVSQFRIEGGDLVELRTSPPRSHPAAFDRFERRPSRLDSGAVVTAGEQPRLFRPFYYTGNDLRGLDVRLESFARPSTAAYTAPYRSFDGPSWYYPARDEETGTTVFEELKVFHDQPSTIIE